jgi:hypothetical protein
VAAAWFDKLTTAGDRANDETFNEGAYRPPAGALRALVINVRVRLAMKSVSQP